MILLSRNPLPKVPSLKLFINGQPVSLLALPLPQTFSVSREQRTILRSYTLQAFSSTLNRSFNVKEDEIVYFVAPLRKARDENTVLDIEVLDWEEMSRAAVAKEEKLKMDALDELDDHIIVKILSSPSNRKPY